MVVCYYYLVVQAQTSLFLLYTTLLNSIFVRLRRLNNFFAIYAKTLGEFEHDKELEIIDRLSKGHEQLNTSVDAISEYYAMPV